MRIVLWVGNESNQKALANKIHEQIPLAGIVTETRISKPKITISKVFEMVMEKLLLKPIADAWFGMKNYYQQRYPDYPSVKTLNVNKINSNEAYQFTLDLEPDLIVVSGTALIRKKLLSLKPSIGIINLHTGLSPYIKGGPNCTNWCLATHQFHLIGNTIMWIDAGIDTGNLIKTEITDFNGEETLTEVHIKVMEHAHQLYLKAILDLQGGKRTNVPQNTIAQGRTYYTKEWGLKEKFAMLKNFKYFKSSINTNKYTKDRSSVTTVE